MDLRRRMATGYLLGLVSGDRIAHLRSVLTDAAALRRPGKAYLGRLPRNPEGVPAGAKHAGTKAIFTGILFL